MHTIRPSVLLKRALLADAVVSAGTALLQLRATQPLIAALDLPRLLLVGAAEFMLVYAAVQASAPGAAAWAAPKHNRRAHP